jgi:hypothetical protein
MPFGSPCMAPSTSVTAVTVVPAPVLETRQAREDQLDRTFQNREAGDAPVIGVTRNPEKPEQLIFAVNVGVLPESNPMYFGEGAPPRFPLGKRFRPHAYTLTSELGDIWWMSPNVTNFGCCGLLFCATSLTTRVHLWATPLRQ